jgi:hypothetical protein
MEVTRPFPLLVESAGSPPIRPRPNRVRRRARGDEVVKVVKDQQRAWRALKAHLSKWLGTTPKDNYGWQQGGMYLS